MTEESVRYAEACYVASPISEYQGNPLIEALPPILSKKEAAARMMLRPRYDEVERGMPTEQRSHLLGRLREIVIPSKEFYDAERIVSRLIRRAYLQRNPLEGATTWTRIYDAQDYAPDRSVLEQLISSDMMVTVLGVSGRGKSTLFHAVLRTYEHQVIRHVSYHGAQLAITQVVWLRVTCPYDASIRDLCLAFFQALDRALGVRKYAPMYTGPRHSIPELQGAMRQLAATYFLGILVIDEIQRLNLAKTGGEKKLLAFVQSLQIDLKVPIAIIGTYSALGLFKSDVAHARRSSDTGLIELARPTQRTEEWDNFVVRLWHYSWVRTPTVLDPEKNGKYFDLLFDLTQGITDVLVILFKCAQERAMDDESETLTTDLLQQVYDDSLTLLHPALNALRSGRTNSIDLFEQLWPSAEQMALLRKVKQGDVEEIEKLLAGLWDKSDSSDDETFSAPSDGGDSSGTAAGSESTDIVVPTGYRDLREFSKCPDVYQALRDAGIIAQNPFDFPSDATAAQA